MDAGRAQTFTWGPLQRRALLALARVQSADETTRQGIEGACRVFVARTPAVNASWPILRASTFLTSAHPMRWASFLRVAVALALGRGGVLKGVITPSKRGMFDGA